MAEMLTNGEFCKRDKKFMSACERSGTPCTPRQASKWRSFRGRAYTWYLNLSKIDTQKFEEDLVNL